MAQEVARQAFRFRAALMPAMVARRATPPALQISNAPLVFIATRASACRDMKLWLPTLILLSLVVGRAEAVTTINATNKFAYGANIGWIDWRGDTNAGAVIGEYVCSG